MEQGCYYVALKAIRELKLICVKGNSFCHKVTLYVWLDALIYLKHAWSKIGIFTELASFLWRENTLSKRSVSLKEKPDVKVDVCFYVIKMT